MVYCKGCDQHLPEDHFAVDRARVTGRRYKCRKCSALEFARWKKTPGYKARLAKGKKSRAALKATNPKRRWAQMALAASKLRARKAGLEHTLTLDWLLEAAGDNCPLLETPLQYANTRSHDDSPAVDRIDNSKGYTPDNCWVISMIANRIKSNATPAQIALVASNLRRHLDKGLVKLVKDTPINEAPPKFGGVNPYAA